MTRHGDGAAVSAKATETRAEHRGAHKASEAANHVHHAAASKVKHARVQEGVGAERREPPCTHAHRQDCSHLLQQPSLQRPSVCRIPPAPG